jgi:hypothetical protein
MKKLVLLSAVVFTLSFVSCEKGALRDLESPSYEELNNGTRADEEPVPVKEVPDNGGILKSAIRIPSRG